MCLRLESSVPTFQGGRTSRWVGGREGRWCPLRGGLSPSAGREWYHHRAHSLRAPRPPPACTRAPSPPEGSAAKLGSLQGSHRSNRSNRKWIVLPPPASLLSRFLSSRLTVMKGVWLRGISKLRVFPESTCTIRGVRPGKASRGTPGLPKPRWEKARSQSPLLALSGLTLTTNLFIHKIKACEVATVMSLTQR